MSDLPKITDVIEVQEISQAEFNRVSPWGSEPKEDNGWISCEDRMPVEGGAVLLGGFECDLIIGCLGSDGMFYEYGDWLVGITHWQDLPLPPMLKTQAS